MNKKQLIEEIREIERKKGRRVEKEQTNPFT